MQLTLTCSYDCIQMEILVRGFRMYAWKPLAVRQIAAAFSAPRKRRVSPVKWPVQGADPVPVADSAPVIPPIIAPVAAQDIMAAQEIAGDRPETAPLG